MNENNARVMAREIQIDGAKYCKSCDTTKPIDEFYLRNKTSMVRHSTCKECDRKRVAGNYDPIKYQEQHLKRSYGITLNEYNEMLEEQGHRCKTCGTTKAGGKHGKFMVDHSHNTGKVRGLLCKSCNIALGEIKDNRQTLLNMVEYLET
jgi:hypothetical protein